MKFKRGLEKIHILGKGPTWVNCPGREEKHEVDGEEIGCTVHRENEVTVEAFRDGVSAASIYP